MDGKIAFIQKFLSIASALFFIMGAEGASAPHEPVTLEPSGTAGYVTARGAGFHAVIAATGAVLRPSAGGEYGMDFAGANPRARIVLENRLPGVSSYFRGGPAQWRVGIQQYGRAKSGDVYPGIDVVWHGNAGNLEYDFVIRPGGDPARIRLAFHGTSGLEVRPDGSLLISAEPGRNEQRRPELYQIVNGRRTTVAGGFRRVGVQDVAFDVESYNRSLPLIIDPALDFATLLGGSGAEGATGVTLDAEKNIYVTGTTESADFPGTALPSSLPPARYQSDVFVTKMDPAGTSILYSVFIGGSGADTAAGIAVDSAGNAYVAGTTGSSDFPTSRCIGGSQKSSRGAFAFRLNAAGTALAWSTCLATNSSAAVHGIVLSPSGNLFVVGSVQGAFPVTSGAAEAALPTPAPDFSPVSGFAAELNQDGSAFVYATYLGGSTGRTTANAAALDTHGDLFVTGSTDETDFPVTAGAYQGVKPSGYSSNAFVTKISADGSAFLYSTYLGGQGSDLGYAIAADAAGNAYVTGAANGGAGPGPPNPFPTTGGVIYPNGSSFNGFLTKMDASGSALIYSTYLPQEAAAYSAFGHAVTIRPDGSVFLAQDFRHIQNFQGLLSGSTTQISVSGTKVLWVNSDATLLLDSEFVPDISVSAMWQDGMSVLIAGQTSPGANIATPGAFQENLKGPEAGAIAKVDFVTRDLPALNIDAQSVIFNQPSADAPAPITLNFTSSGVPIAFHLANPVTNTGTSGLAYTFSLSQTDAVTPAQITVTPNVANLQFSNPGYFSVLAPGAANSLQLIPVYLNQQSSSLKVSYSNPAGLAFGFSGNDAAPQQETMTIDALANSPFRYGPGTHFAEPFYLTSDQSWLTVTPATGTTPAAVTVTANPSGLANGIYTANLYLRGNVSPVQQTLAASMVIGPQLNAGTLQTFQSWVGGPSASQTLTITTTPSGLPVTITAPSVSWLSVTPLQATTPASVSVVANPAGLAAGLYSATILVSGAGTTYRVTARLDVLASAPSGVSVAAVISSAANPPGGGVAPGSLASVYGKGFTDSTAQATSLPLPAQLGNVSVTIGGYAAPLLYVSSGQINLEVPSEVPPGNAAVQVTGPFGSASGTVTIAQSQPGMFVNYSASLAPIIVNADGSLNDASHLTHPGEYVVLYMTGQGPLDTPVPDGAAAPSNPPARATLPVTVTIGGLNAHVAFAGLTPTLTSLFQVNVQIPEIYSGTHPLVVTVGSSTSDVFPISVGN